MTETVLPDYLKPGLRVVMCGTAPGLISAQRGHYYAGPGNRFWFFLHESGLTPVLLHPSDDANLAGHGIGLTDLVKTMAQSHDKGLVYDVARLEASLARVRPAWVGFTSKEAGKAAARFLGEKPPSLGAQEWRVADSRAFVLPSPSGRNQGRTSYDGRESRLEWWSEFAELVKD